MKLYNLFPLLAGPFDRWTPHLDRAAAMGFDWIFVNPIQQLGQSGSLYSIADYFAINPALISDDDNRAPDDQVRALADTAANRGLRLMTDLVINHCAIDSPLVKQHPKWFQREGKRVVNPFCVEADGHKVVWQDLAQFDHQAALRKPEDPEGLIAFCQRMIEHLIGLGFTGFRCDAAYQLPAEFWRRLIEPVRQAHPEVVFVAETLGCSPEQTRETADAGFDAIFNSAKWWDFEQDWLLEQYEATRQIAPSIGFPESHDTERLAAETQGNLDALRQRYLFTALFASGVMMPMGYEFGFQQRLDVVHTRPADWEGPRGDLSDLITQVNAIKDRVPLFSGEGRIERLHHPDPAILVLRKHAEEGPGQGLLVINKDCWNRQCFWVEDLHQLLDSEGPIQDLSPDWPMDALPAPFEFWLGPGMARVLVNSQALHIKRH